MDLKTRLKNILRMCGHAMVSTIHERLDRIEARSSEVEASLLQASIHTIETLREMNHAVVAESSDGRVYTAELALMEFLYSHLPGRTAVDIAANEGDVSKALLDTGFEVYAFEPDAARFERLERRLGGRSGFHLFRAAVGNVARQGEIREERTHHTALHPDVALQVQATSAIAESRTTLGHLCREGILPEHVSLMCIESGESSLEVIRGMGTCNYPVVVATYSGSDGAGGVRYRTWKLWWQRSKNAATHGTSCSIAWKIEDAWRFFRTIATPSPILPAMCFSSGITMPSRARKRVGDLSGNVF